VSKTLDTCRENVEIPDTRSSDRRFTTQSSSVFNQLPRPQLERVFGRRSALLFAVEADQGLEERRNMTIYTGR
jgi:hypothetical protein